MKTRYNVRAIINDKQGHCLSLASNSYTKSHPLQAHFAKLAGQPNKIYLHAEILALIRSSLYSNNKPYEINISRIKDNKDYSAKPCPICVLAMEAFGIKIVNYTTNKGWVYGKKVEEFKDEYRSIYAND